MCTLLCQIRKTINQLLRLLRKVVATFLNVISTRKKVHYDCPCSTPLALSRCSFRLSEMEDVLPAANEDNSFIFLYIYIYDLLYIYIYTRVVCIFTYIVYHLLFSSLTHLALWLVSFKLHRLERQCVLAGHPTICFQMCLRICVGGSIYNASYLPSFHWYLVLRNLVADGGTSMQVTCTTALWKSQQMPPSHQGKRTKYLHVSLLY